MKKRFGKRASAGDLVFWICFTIYTLLSFYLFYQQSAGYSDGSFLSDMPHYINGVLGLNERDPYPYRLFFWIVGALNFVFPIRLSATLGTVLLNTLTVFILRHYIKKYLYPYRDRFTLKRNGNSLSYYELLTAILTFACLLSSMIILPFDFLYKFPGKVYIGMGSGNLWHNATYLATRPFATLSFFLFTDLLDNYENKLDLKKTLIFATSLFLTVFAKPTFAVVMLPAAAITLLYRLFIAKFKNFKNTVYFALSFLPALFDMLRQYLPVFGASEESGIGFGFGIVWKNYTKSIFLSLLLCFAFAIYIRLCNLRDSEHKTLLNFSWVFLFVSLFEGIFLYEKGSRMVDGNFMQGYLHAMFYLFVVSAVVWLGRRSTPGRRKIYDIAALFFFSAHVLSGCYYFIRLLLGYSFY